MNNDNKFQNTTCFSAHKKCNKVCANSSCRHWHDLEGKNNNCIINLVNNSREDFTLQEIGNLFNITRMRVCQIEKQTLAKLNKKISLS